MGWKKRIKKTPRQTHSHRGKQTPSAYFFFYKIQLREVRLWKCVCGVECCLFNSGKEKYKKRTQLWVDFVPPSKALFLSLGVGHFSFWVLIFVCSAWVRCCNFFPACSLSWISSVAADGYPTRSPCSGHLAKSRPVACPPQPPLLLRKCLAEANEMKELLQPSCRCRAFAGVSFFVVAVVPICRYTSVPFRRLSVCVWLCLRNNNQCRTRGTPRQNVYRNKVPIAVSPWSFVDGEGLGLFFWGGLGRPLRMKPKTKGSAVRARLQS